jgi:hypothetical protein
LALQVLIDKRDPLNVERAINAYAKNVDIVGVVLIHGIFFSFYLFSLNISPLSAVFFIVPSLVVIMQRNIYLKECALTKGIV